VKDTLEVSDKLNEVRGAIEERQAEFEALSKQVETVAINITLRAEADAQVFGLNWRPLYQVKIAAREGLGGLADYAASMTAFVFYLPTVLLWLFTILAGKRRLVGGSYSGRRKSSLGFRRWFASSRTDPFTEAYAPRLSYSAACLLLPRITFVPLCSLCFHRPTQVSPSSPFSLQDAASRVSTK
jgi:hypothetical protein